MQVAKVLFRWTSIAVSSLLVATVLLMMVLVVAERRERTTMPVIFNRALLTVMSGSMTPHIDTGDMILDQMVTPSLARQLRVGQVITYRTRTTGNTPSLLITHRIVGVFKVAKAGSQAARKTAFAYITKGDANNVQDQSPVSPAQVVGLYIGRIPYLGYIGMAAHKPTGFALLVILPVLYLIGGEVWRLWRVLDEKERRTSLGESAAKIKVNWQKAEKG